MSGVYIKGMEMPENCHMCVIGFGGCCYIAPPESHGLCPDEGRADFCPLVRVPPHGLINRAQILDAIRLELAQANALNDMEDYAAWMRVFDYVRKFPTIIPAESEETE